MTSQKLYIDLLKKSLVDLIYSEANVAVPIIVSRPWYKLIVKIFDLSNLKIVRFTKIDRQKRILGRDWPINAHTMIGLKRLDNIQFCIDQILKNNIPGDFIEAGVWRGGACILMRGILEAYNIRDRVMWVADSFKGLPKPDLKGFPQDKGVWLHEFKYTAVSLSEVKDNFKTYGLLDKQVKFLKGWFKDTLPKAPIKKLALIRADGDMYQSTMDILTNLYPKLSPGGFMIVDDYVAMPQCREAVNDFRRSFNIKDKIQTIDGRGIFWQKTYNL